MTIPFLDIRPIHDQVHHEMLQAFEEVYKSNWFVLGDRVKSFEKSYALFSEVKHAIGVSNGLDALLLALKTLDIGPGDEVIVPSNTFIATVLAVSHTGATPVFVEPDINTQNIDPQKITAAITPNTRAIIAVHLYGQACDMAAIAAIAKLHNIKIIEDNAQAHGASFAGKPTGAWGHINATSFYPMKNLGALGDGGALTTNDDSLARKAAMLRNYGSEKKYYNEALGYNMRLDECQAAFLSIKLKYIRAWNSHRQQLAQRYNEQLAGIEGLELPVVHRDATHVYHLYVIRTERRDELMRFLSRKRINTMIHYPVPPHLQEAYLHLGYKAGDFPIAEQLADTCLSLPMWPGMKDEEVDFVTNNMKKFFMPNYPLVSVAAINYNNSKYIIETLESINNQTYPNIELIVVDDCSTDDSVAIIKNWLDTCPRPFKFVRHSVNKGVSAACNSGVFNATGKYYSAIATDDIAMPEKVMMQVELMEDSGEDIAAVYSDAFLIDEESKPLPGMFIQNHRRFSVMPSGNIYETLLQGNYIPGMTFLFRRNILNEIGPFDEELIYEDYDMWLRISRKYDILFSDYVAASYRMRPGSLSNSIKNWNYTDAKIFLKHASKTTPLPFVKLKKIALDSYIHRDQATLAVVKQLGKKTGNRYIKAAWLMWRYRINKPTATVILSRTERRINAGKNNLYIDLCIYKDIIEAILRKNVDPK